jgi:F0F1-type ATP synthase gamma subunit
MTYKDQEDISDVKAMVEVYQEIAATRMQVVKLAILGARQYYESLALLVREVRPWLRTQAQKKKTAEKPTKTALFFSANTGLYGDIIEKVGRDFLKYVAEEESEAAVIGLVGKRMMESVHTSYPITYISCDDAHPSKEDILSIITYAQQFDHVEVFYGRFVNLISQIPYRNILSGEEAVSEAVGKDWKKTSFYYLFEPNTNEITSVVEKEIFASVIEQILHESNFSKFASRMIHLDQALQNIDERLFGMKLEQRRLMRRQENKKQLSRLSGRMLWHT